MPDTDMLNIIKISINTIGAEQTRGSNKCCTNMHTVHGVKPKQETGRAEKCYTNMDSISKSNNKMKPMVKRKSHKTTEYFLSGLSYKSDKKRSAETTQQIHKDFEDVFNGTGCLIAHFHCRLIQIASHTKCLWEAWHTHFKNHSRKN